MLKTAKDLESTHPNSVAFLDFSDKDFDLPVVITPSNISSTMWHKFLDLALGDLSNMIAPSTVVFCEGSIEGKGAKNFDATVYKSIFSGKHSDVEFCSIGSCSEIENLENVSMRIVTDLLKSSNVIKIVDRDDKSEIEVTELLKKGIKTLKRRHIECYLLDDEIIDKLCRVKGKDDKIADCMALKASEMSKSVARGNAIDDVKSASGAIYVGLKKVLGLVACGNTRESFLRDTMTPLITEETQVYKELEKEIFG